MDSSFLGFHLHLAGKMGRMDQHPNVHVDGGVLGMNLRLEGLSL
jgi:hypothetical protein